MKKIIAVKVSCILAMILFVLVIPIVCAFIPYQSPDVIYETFEVNISEDSTYAEVYGELKNPTVVKLESVEITIGFYDENREFIASKTVLIDQQFNACSTTEFYAQFMLSISGAEYFTCESIAYTYYNLTWYMYFMIGLVAYCIFILLFAKQKYYFTVDDKAVEVYVSGNKVAIAVDGAVVAEQVGKAQTLHADCKIGEKSVTVDASKSYFIPGPKVDIKVDGEKPVITNATQHSFVKVVDKKKEKSVM